MEPTILTDILKTFLSVFDAGAARLIPDALVMLKALTVIELVILGGVFVLRGENDILALMMKVTMFGVFIWLIQQWPALGRTLANSLIGAGLLAGGDQAISMTDFNDPGNIALYGMNVTAVVFAKLREYAGLDALKNLVEILFSGIAACLVVCSYFLLAIWIFIALLEFYAIAAVSVILVPFGMFEKTAFLAEKAIAAVCGCGVQLLCLSFVVSAAMPVMVQRELGLNPGFRDIMVQLLVALALLGLSWRANRWGQALLHGSPKFHIQDVQQVVQNTVSTVNTVMGSVGSAVSGAAQAMTGRR